jgi:hypothetical protein
VDEAQVLALLQQALADAGVSETRTRAAWGLDYATILNEAAVTYADTTLTAPEVLTEIADTLTA